MALSNLTAAPLPPGQPIVNPATGAPTTFFLDWLTDLTQRLVIAVNALNTAVTTIQSQNNQQIAQQQQTVSAAQSAAQAQATADSGSSAQSGDATVNVSVPAGAGWFPGPQVDLAGVVAGTLSAVNSGPSQIPSTNVVNEGVFTGNYRIREIVGMVETTIFTGTFSAERTQEDIGFITILFNETDTTTFTTARASTGVVSYRMDFNSPDVEVDSILAYLYVRRS